MINKAQDIEKVASILEEVEASFKFITAGLLNLKEQKSPASNNHVTLQLLASGIERVLKILLLLKDKHLNGHFPEFQNAKDRFQIFDSGHGILKMLDDLIEYSTNVELMNSNPMVVEDMEYLRNDQNFRTFLKILTDFSIKQRYYYIDTIILGNQNGSSNPFQAFKSFIDHNYAGVDESKMSYEQEDKLLIYNTIICIEKGVRAISRFFTHGLGTLGIQYYNDFASFILLSDEDLGTFKYAKQKKLSSESYKPMIQFSLSFVKIHILSSSKSIHSKNHPDWAFTIDRVKVYSQKGESHGRI